MICRAAQTLTHKFMDRMNFFFLCVFIFVPVFREFVQRRPRFPIVLCRDVILGHMNIWEKQRKIQVKKIIIVIIKYPMVLLNRRIETSYTITACAHSICIVYLVGHTYTYAFIRAATARQIHVWASTKIAICNMKKSKRKRKKKLRPIRIFAVFERMKQRMHETRLPKNGYTIHLSLLKIERNAPDN